MTEFGGALDRYLEAPYIEAADRAEHFERWAEANLPDLDWDDEQAVDAAMIAFERWQDEQWDDVPW